MRNLRRGGLRAAGFFFALSMYFPLAAESPGQAPSTADHPWIGEAAPPIELMSLDGKKVSLASFAGTKIVVLHFAASW